MREKHERGDGRGDVEEKKRWMKPRRREKRPERRRKGKDKGDRKKIKK